MGLQPPAELFLPPSFFSFFSSSFLKQTSFFQSSFRFRVELRGNYRGISFIPPSMLHSLPHHQQPSSQSGAFVTADEPTLASLSFTVCSLHQGSLLVLYILWVWTKCIMTYIHDSITQSSSTAPKSSVLCLLIPPPLELPATTGIFTPSMVLPFPQCSVLGSYSMQSVSDWLLNLVVCIQGSPMSFLGLMAHFFLVLNNKSVVWIYHSFFFYPFTY